MRYLMLVFCLTGAFFLYSQEEVLPEKIVNKHYLGINVLTPLAYAFASNPIFNEWKLQYKGSIKGNNQFMRFSYANFRDNTEYFTGNVGFPGTYITDTSSFYSYTDRGTGNFNILKAGYEYQAAIGKAQKITVNMGADFTYRINQLSFVTIADTIFHNNYRLEGDLIVTNRKDSFTRSISFQNWLGVSPFVALGIPLHKNIDITFEFAFDLMWNLNDGTANFYGLNIFEPYYKPSVMVSYTFGRR